MPSGGTKLFSRIDVGLNCGGRWHPHGGYRALHSRFLKTTKENNMKLRIAILAACASTLALAQVDVARANYNAASGSKSLVRITDIWQVADALTDGLLIVRPNSQKQKAGLGKTKPSTSNGINIKGVGGKYKCEWD
jgi:hypothetical protein